MRVWESGELRGGRWLGAVIVSLGWAGCAAECSQGFVGSSTGAPQVVESLALGSGGYGSGTAAGLWSLTLVPTASGTSCVNLEITPAVSETYAYTLEFKGTEGVQLYLEGVPFAEGLYEDFPVEDGTADRVQWKTPLRTASDRPGGAVEYTIEGEGRLSPNSQAAVLTWTGWERITVLSSEDPEIREGCTYSYDVSGYKVCDE